VPYIAGAATSAIGFAVALLSLPPSADVLAESADHTKEAAPAARAAQGGEGSGAAHAEARWGKIVVCGLLNVCLSFAVAAAMFVVALYLQAKLGWDQGAVAAILTGTNVLGLGFQFGGFELLQRRLGLLRVGALSGLSLASAYAALTLISGPSPFALPIVCAVTVLQGAGISVSMAVPSPLLAQYATPATMGRVMAFAATTGTFGRVVAPLSLALLFGLDPALPLYLTSAVCLLGALGYLAVQLVEWREAAAAAEDDHTYSAM